MLGLRIVSFAGYPEGLAKTPLSPSAHPVLIFFFLQLVFMEDKRYSNPITCWCYAKEPGKELTGGPPVPCKKEACERYRAKYPYCIQMERRERHGFVIPE